MGSLIISVALGSEAVFRDGSFDVIGILVDLLSLLDLVLRSRSPLGLDGRFAFAGLGEICCFHTGLQKI